MVSGLASFTKSLQESGRGKAWLVFKGFQGHEKYQGKKQLFWLAKYAAADNNPAYTFPKSCLFSLH